MTSRDIGLTGAIAIGIGGMVGGGIFAVLGEAVSIAHGATGVAFFFAGVVAMLTAYSYAKLSVACPSRGGTVAFVNHAFGNSLFSATVNFMLWLSYLVTISLYAVAFADYAATFFTPPHPRWLKHGLISTAILLPMAINLFSAAFVSRSETLFVILKLGILLLIIIAGVAYVDVTRLSPAQWESPLSIIAAGMVIFVAYEGFELIANAAEEVREPAKTLPRAFYLSVVIVIVLYIAIALITVGSVDEQTLMVAKDYALAVAAKPSLGQVGFTLVSVAALLATFSAINATLFGNARLATILALEGALPASLQKMHKENPVRGIVASVAFSLLVANLIDLNEIAIIGSAGFLLIFSIANVSALKLAGDIGANRGILLLAIVCSASALLTLLAHTWRASPHAIVVFAGFVLLAFVFELSYGRLIRKRFHLQ